MGFSPNEVDALSVWEFAACAKGYARAHGAPEKKQGAGMSEDVMRDLGIKGIV